MTTSNPPPDLDALEARFAVEFKQLMLTGREVMLVLTAVEAWQVFSLLQLALRHPGNNGATAVFGRLLARQLETAVTPTPALVEVARRGWDPAYDE